MTVAFRYQPTEDFGKPLLQRLGDYPRSPDMLWDGLRWLSGWTNWAFVRFQFPVTVTGQLPVMDRLCLVANHQSHLDTALMLAILPEHRRCRLSVLAAQDYFFTGVSRALFASLFCRAVAYDRLHWTSVRIWYRQLEKMARDNRQEWIFFFPSGSRKSQKIETGLLKLFLKAGWPVLPVRIEGTGEALPHDAALWKPGSPLGIHFGEVFDPATCPEVSPDEQLVQLKSRLETWFYDKV